jgi:hypothetical protein
MLIFFGIVDEDMKSLMVDEVPKMADVDEEMKISDEFHDKSA